MDLSANCKDIMVAIDLPMPSFLNIESHIKLMLAPKSHKALTTGKCFMLTGIIKLSGSFNFCGSFFCIIALTSSVNMIVSLISLSFLPFYKSPFINLEKEDICSKASEKGRLIPSFLKTSRNLKNFLSKFPLTRA